MKINILYTLFFFYLTLSSTLIETKNIIKSNILKRNKYTKRMHKFTIKLKSHKYFLDYLKDIIYLPFKSNPTESNASPIDKLIGLIMFFFEIIRSLGKQPISDIIGKVLDHYDEIKSCLLKYEDIQNFAKELFPDCDNCKNILDPDEIEKMKSYQKKILDYFPDDYFVYDTKEKKDSDDFLYRKCTALKSNFKNTVFNNKFVDNMRLYYPEFDNSQTYAENQGIMDDTSGKEDSMKYIYEMFGDVYKEFSNELNSFKDKLFENSLETINKKKENKIIDDNYCFYLNKQNNQPICFENYMNLREKYFQISTRFCDLPEVGNKLTLKNFLKFLICEEYEFYTKDENILNLIMEYKKWYKNIYSSFKDSAFESREFHKNFDEKLFKATEFSYKFKFINYSGKSSFKEFCENNFYGFFKKN